MPSTPTNSLRLEKQGQGEHLNSWGSGSLNTALDMIDAAIAGTAAIVVTGSFTLASVNYTADQARNAILSLTGTPAAPFTVTTPGVSKIYYVRNATGQTATFACGAGATATVPTGQTWILFCDGVNWAGIVLPGTLDQNQAAVAPVNFGGQAGVNAANPQNPQDLCTKAYADALAWTANAGILPGQVGNDGKFLFTKNQVASWMNLPLATSSSITSAANVILTASSASCQSIAITAAGCAVQLPDATTLSFTGIAFLIHNTGTLAYLVTDYAGGVVAIIPPNGKALFLSQSDASAAGNWKVGNLSDFSPLQTSLISTASVVNTAALGNQAIVRLSATTALYVYGPSSGPTLVGVVLTLNNGGVQPGLPAPLGGQGTSWEQINLQAISSTQVAILYSADAPPTAGIITITGTVPTLGPTVTPLGSIIPRGGVGMCLLSPTLALFACAPNSGTTLTTAAATISGNTLAPGDTHAVTVAAYNGNYFAVAPLTATSGAVFLPGASAALTGVILNVAGTTVSDTGQQTIDGTNTTNAIYQAIGLSPSQVLLRASCSSSGSSALYLIGNNAGTLTEQSFLALGGVGGADCNIVQTGASSFKVFDVENTTNRPIVRQVNITIGNNIACTYSQYLNSAPSVAVTGPMSPGVKGVLLSGTNLMWAYGSSGNSSYPIAAEGTFLQ
ncbi:hypothetical protein [Telmatospirillum sp.]|uniref:hypothetical protein n=1 Tax=Telmatospirillum sp. TaxID=2079197 RepID=UPI0028508B6F|nr:hypothetical protein [Telmatospirillum sp.]MDR3439879.1 hypothetical protein [Telmatospirillum sp.]